MKPLTPRMRMRFIEAEFVSLFFLDFDEAQDFTIAADGEPLAIVLVGTGRPAARAELSHLRAVHPEAVAESPGEGRRHGAHEVMDLLGALRPVDAAVLGTSAAKVAAAREIVRLELHSALHERRKAALEHRPGGVGHA